MKEELSSFVSFRKLTESVNGKLAVIECSVLKQQNSLETILLNMVNLAGDWPEQPCNFTRKNYPKLIEFVMFNSKKQNTKHFISQAINHLAQFKTEETLKQLLVANKGQLPHQFYVSNSGNRVSFWLEEEIVNFLMDFKTIAQLFKPFAWLSEQQPKAYNNEIQYGSQNFINLVEMLSLDSQMKLLSLEEYGGFEFKQIEESLQTVTSLINYNYRFFFPPKHATRFLKKTSGIVLTSKTQIKEKRSKKWAESVFLDSLFQVRPTKSMARMIGNPSGPIYLEKHIFSDNFYAQIEKVYFMGEIQDYLSWRNIRNNKKYLTFGSRMNPQSLFSVQAKQELDRLNDQGWLNKEIELFTAEQQQSESDQDSEDQEVTMSQPLDQDEKSILALYSNSDECVLQKLKAELSTRINQTKAKQTQMQDEINQFEQESAHRVLDIDQLTNSCRAGNVSFCNSCGFSNSKITSSENSLVEFISLFNYGNDSFCQTCSDLSIKQRIIAQKIRQFQERQQVAEEIAVMKMAQEEALMKQENLNENKSESCVSKNAEQMEQKPEKQHKEDKQPIEKLQSPQKSKQIPETKQQSSSAQNKTEQQKFVYFIGQLLGSNNIEQDTEYQKIKEQIHQALLSAHQSLRDKAQQQRKTNAELKSPTLERRFLLAQKYSLTWYLMMLRLKNQCNEFISGDYFHDSFQLSLLASHLTSSQYQHDQLLDVYEYYFNRMLSLIIKTNPGNETELVSIPSILDSIRTLKQLKYQQVLQNVFDNVLNKSIKSGEKGQKHLAVENQREELTMKLLLFVDQKQDIYNAYIAEHYRTYKQAMSARYKVTQFELKEMISKFQTQLKDKILKTTQEFLFSIRWLILIITEYVQAKTAKLKTLGVSFQEDNGIAFFVNEVELLLNLVATLIHVFNQPGQAKAVEVAESEMVNCLILMIENERGLKQKMKIDFDGQVVGVLLQDMLQHFVAKASSGAKEDALKLTNKHMQKFKSSFSSKLKSLQIKRLFNSQQQFAQYKFKLSHECLTTYSKRDITLSKNLYVAGSLNNSPGYFSSLLFLNEYFEKHQRTYYHNFEIWGLMTLLGSVTRMCLKRQTLVMASKSEPNHKIKLGLVYKLIVQTLQKSECAPELINVYKSGNKLLLNLTSYLISESYNITLNSTLNQEIAAKIKLFVERTRYRYLKNTPNTMQFHTQTTEILDFLFKNRHSFFNPDQAQTFETQFHMIIQIVALNALPIFNIEIAYKTQLKEIGKTLRHFDVNDGYNQIQDYYLKVLNFRHNKSKDKRKKQIQTKKDKNQPDNLN